MQQAGFLPTRTAGARRLRRFSVRISGAYHLDRTFQLEAAFTPRPGGSLSLFQETAFVSEDLDQVNKCVGGLLQAFSRVELEFAVKVVSAGKEVRCRQALESESRAVGAAALRFLERRHSSLP